MKKILICFVVLLTLTACGSTNTESKPKIVEIDHEEVVQREKTKVLEMEGLPEELSMGYLTQEEIELLCEEENPVVLSNEINTIADAVNFFKAQKYNHKDKTLDGFDYFINRGGEDMSVVNAFTYLLEDDYDDFYYVELHMANKRRCFLIIKDGNDYIPVNTNDFHSQYANFDKWMFGYSEPLLKGDNLEDVMYSMTRMIDGWFSVYEYGEVPYQGGDLHYLTKSGAPVKVEKETPVIYYDYASIPFELGENEYSDEEIDEFLKEKEFEKLPDKIHTLADAINLVIRGDFVFGDGYIRGQNSSVGGLQALKNMYGNSGTLASILNYLLDGDYEEIAYICNGFEPAIYIYQDEKYYLISTNDYIRHEDEQDELDHVPVGGYEYEVVCSENLQDIIDEIERVNKKKNSRDVFVSTWSNPKKAYGFPFEGSDVTYWVGEKKHDRNSPIDQDELVDDEDVVFNSGQGNLEHYDRKNKFHYRGW